MGKDRWSQGGGPGPYTRQGSAAGIASGMDPSSWGTRSPILPTAPALPAWAADCTFSRSARRALNPLRRVISAMAMPDSPSLPFRLQRDMSRAHMLWVTDTQPRPLPCLYLLAWQCPMSGVATHPRPLRSPDAHCVLHSGLLVIRHPRGLPPAAIPSPLKQLQRCHSLGTGIWVILGWKLLIHIVLVVLIGLPCTGTVGWLGCSPAPSGPKGLQPQHSLVYSTWPMTVT